MKTTLLIILLTLLTGCGTMQPMPAGSVPFYLPPPPPMTFYPIPTQQVTTCAPVYGGSYRCTTR